MAHDIVHQNIVRYKYFIQEKIQTRDVYNVVMEYIEGKNMCEYIKDVGAPKLSQLPYVKQIGLQILKGIKHLHSNYIIHGNIVP